MQTLQGLFDGSVSFESIAASFADLQNQLLGRSQSAGEGSGNRYGRVTGNPQFHFTLTFEPRSEGGGLCQTGVLTASASTEREGGSPLPLTCRWKRNIGSCFLEITGIRGDRYHCSADDIGMGISCQAEVSNNPSLGQAVGTMGPFELDPITRLSVENLITSGNARFPVRHFRDQDDPQPRDLQIHVSQDCVKVVYPGADRANSEVSAPYTADYPKVLIHPLDTCKFRLLLTDEQEKMFHFVALSRTSRDLIALLVRCFHARKYVATSFILSRLYQNPATPGAPLTSVNSTSVDLPGLTQCLQKELDRTTQRMEKAERTVRISTQEKLKLQEQLKDTIGSYTEAIEKMHQQLAMTQGNPTASAQLQLHDSRAQFSRLQMELTDLKQKLEEEKEKGPQGSGVDATEAAQRAAAADALRREINELRSKISAITGDAALTNQRDLTRAEELRRLRTDVESLNREREGLEDCLGKAEKDKQELIENFLYVKGCLDKLQVAHLQSPMASPEFQRQVAQLKASYSQVVDERNRLAIRAEALDRDREKQKLQKESDLERLMNANARLMEEKDRLEKEKASLSSLYQNTVAALGASQGAAGKGSAQDSLAILQALQSEVAAKTDQLSKRDQEGESLRARLRKLARV